MVFENVRIVLVETSHPGNIGAVARAMKTMGFSELVLVNPLHYPSAEATSRASGADDVLARARVVSSLPEAVAGCQLVVGASARLRSVEWPQMNPRECGEQIVVEAGRHQVALVLGRERTGLSNEELDSCQFLVHVPANPEYSSLNLAAAAQVLCYEIRMAVLQGQGALTVEEDAEPLSTADEMERFYSHMESVLLEIGFFKPPNNQKLMRRLRRLFSRSRLDRTELDIMHGVLSAAEGRKYRWMKEAGLTSGSQESKLDENSQK